MTSNEAVFAGGDGSVECMKLLGANPKPRFELDKQSGIGNYFIGNDPSNGRMGKGASGKKCTQNAFQESC